MTDAMETMTITAKSLIGTAGILDLKFSVLQAMRKECDTAGREPLRNTMALRKVEVIENDIVILTFTVKTRPTSPSRNPLPVRESPANR